MGSFAQSEKLKKTLFSLKEDPEEEELWGKTGWGPPSSLLINPKIIPERIFLGI